MESFSVSTINQTEARKTGALHGRLEGLPNGHALLFSHPTSETIAVMPSRLSITENSGYSKGREDSMHGVWFGDGVISSDNSTQLSKLPIAIKPYPGRSQVLAIPDYEACSELNRLGGWIEGLPFLILDLRVTTTAF